MIQPGLPLDIINAAPSKALKLLINSSAKTIVMLEDRQTHLPPRDAQRQKHCSASVHRVVRRE
jgi:hypothetical protein